MGHNKPISYGEEFQIIYVDALKEVEHNPSLLSLWYIYIVTLPKRTIWKGRGEKSNFAIEKPDKHYLSQVIKVNINSEKLC